MLKLELALEELGLVELGVVEEDEVLGFVDE